MSAFQKPHPRVLPCASIVALLMLAVSGGAAQARTSAEADPGPVATRHYERTAYVGASGRTTWTPARMRAAVADAARRKRKRGRARRRVGRRWASANPTARLLSSDLPGTRVIGRLFSKRPDGSNYVCSATLVESANRSVVWTAGHCVHGGAGSGPHTDFVFVPGYRPAALGGPAPFGVWPAIASRTTRAWARRGDKRHYRRDVGGVVLARDQQGRTLTDVLGAAQRIAFGHRPRRVAALGYPLLPPFNGESLYKCGPNPIGRIDSARGRGFDPLAVACAQTAGSSGGPWLAGTSRSTGIGTIVSVTSIKANAGPWLFGPVLDRAARRVYAKLSATPN